MIFRQLFEPLSSTYTYLIGCEDTGQALLIDPVINSASAAVKLLDELWEANRPYIRPCF